MSKIILIKKICIDKNNIDEYNNTYISKAWELSAKLDKPIPYKKYLHKIYSDREIP